MKSKALSSSIKDSTRTVASRDPSSQVDKSSVSLLQGRLLKTLRSSFSMKPRALWMRRVRKSFNRHSTEQWRVVHRLSSHTDSAQFATANGCLSCTRERWSSRELMNSYQPITTHISTSLSPVWKCENILYSRTIKSSI
jgi:hypothetical protein